MSLRAAVIRATKAWGLRPSDLGLCAPEDDVVYMVAWERTEAAMIAWEEQERERESKRKKKFWQR